MGLGTTADVINSAGIRFSANGKRIFIVSTVHLAKVLVRFHLQMLLILLHLL